MYMSANVNTPFHIDLDWWRAQNRNLGRYLVDILGEDVAVDTNGEPIDFIDPETAEVHSLDPLWVKVLMHRAARPDYISSTTPMTSAVLRALIENRNRPMTPVELHRRINRASPQALLRLMQTTRAQYGIVPADMVKPERSSARRSK